MTFIKKLCLRFTGTVRHASRMESGPKPPKYLLVGLGNHALPKTRHSVGMMAVNRLAKHLDVQWTKDSKNCVGFVACKTLSQGLDLVLLKPKIPMNINGSSIAKTIRHHGIAASNVYLLHDELDKPLGKFGMKENGSARGHNGVRSAISSLKTDVIPRLRIGIDRPTNQNDVVNYVLTHFSAAENEQLDAVLDSSLKMLLLHLGKKTEIDLRGIIPSQDKKAPR